MPYVPGVPPASADDLLVWVMDQLEQISAEFQETVALELRPSFRPPDKPREGMIVYADGTRWNPGAGKGVYVFEGAIWTKL